MSNPCELDKFKERRRWNRIPNSILCCKDLSNGAVRVYGRLQWYCRDTTSCFPSEKTLANDIGLCVRQVYNYLKELESYNLIRIEHARKEKRADGYFNRYHLVWLPELMDKDLLPPSEADSYCCETRDQKNPSAATHIHSEKSEARDQKFSAEEHIKSKTLRSHASPDSEAYASSSDESQERNARAPSEPPCARSEGTGSESKGAQICSNKTLVIRPAASRVLKKKPIINNSAAPPPAHTDKPFVVPRTVQPFIDAWNEIALRKHKNPDTKVYQEAVDCIKRLLTGRMFDDISGMEKWEGVKFTYQDWVNALSNFELMLSPDYYPIKKDGLHNVSLPSFIYNRFNQNGNRSLFLKMLQDSPRSLQIIPPDTNPALTKALIALYKRQALGGLYNKEALPPNELAAFVKATNKLESYFESNRNKILPIFVDSPSKKADLIWNAIVKSAPDPAAVKPWYLCSDISLDILSRYITRQGLIVRSSRGSGWLS